MSADLLFRQKYKSSIWTHIINHNSVVIFFNSRNLEILNGDQETLKLFNFFNTPKSLLEALKEFKHNEVLDTLKTFIEFQFLVYNDVNEIIQLSKSLIPIQLERSKNSFSRKINSIRLVLTENCNLRCDYCFVTENKTKLYDNEKDSIIKGLDKIIELNHGHELHIQFFGGEPTIKFELIKDIVEYTKEKVYEGRIKQVSFSITTNATLIYPEMAKFFFSNNFEISVSIDGWSEINDKHRNLINGKSSFMSLYRGIQLLQQYHNNISALLTLNNDNIDVLVEICEYIIKNLNIKNISINTPQPTPIGWQINGKILSDKIIESMHRCKELGGRLYTVGDVILHAIDSKKPQLLPCTSDDGCMIVLAPGNKISYCKVNWIEEECCEPITIKPLNSKKMSQWKLSDPYGSNECIGCIAMNTCGGPCPIENLYLKKTGHLDRNGHCNFYKNFTKWAIIQESCKV